MRATADVNPIVSGTRFGKLVALSEVPCEDRKVRNFREYYCKCDCGKTIRTRRNALISGRSKSCGCYRTDANEITLAKYRNDIIGKKFGRLMVLTEAPKSEWKNKKKREFVCRCDCGKTVNKRRNALITGNTKSCGCLFKDKVNNQWDDISGKTFGELTAIRREKSVLRDTGNSTMWLFKCSCGREVVASIVNVKNLATKSCGHIGKSFAEYQIGKWLTENNIRFDIQATFDDLRNPETNCKLRYDFKIYKNDGSYFILEHNGIQHFRNTTDGFGKLQREHTDKIKHDYCKARGIALYETSYNEDYMGKLREIITTELEWDSDDEGVMTG